MGSNQALAFIADMIDFMHGVFLSVAAFIYDHLLTVGIVLAVLLPVIVVDLVRDHYRQLDEYERSRR